MEITLLWTSFIGLIGVGLLTWLRRRIESGYILFEIKSKSAENCQKELEKLQEENRKLNMKIEYLESFIQKNELIPKCPFHKEKEIFQCKYIELLEVKK